jgi:hypothetical protein
MDILPENRLASRDQRRTSLPVVECAHLQPWSQSSTHPQNTFASAIMKIIMRYGFCHTVVLDKGSKFFGVCRKLLDLLMINCHVLFGGNHNPMLVERINRYLNKGLKIMVNK